MPHEVFQLATVTRVFADEVELAEALGFSEISALDDSERKWRSCLQSKAKAVLEDAALSPAFSLHRRKIVAPGRTRLTGAEVRSAATFGRLGTTADTAGSLPALGGGRFVSRIRSRSRSKGIAQQDVIAQFVKLTGLPEVFLRDELPLAIERVKQQFAAQIIGQPEAVTASARLITTLKAGLTDPGRPLGVLMFCGPTGVGKTALVKSLVEFCFGASGAKDRLVRLDMSEYSALGAAQRLLQNSQGRPADWIERVRRQPFCVVLFDEIEKAALEVFDVLLGLLDEGRLTDRFGRVTWFRSAIVIMTSNLGANAPNSAGFAAVSGPSYESEVSKFFRPEFFNRLDGVITFKPLALEQVELIARKELAELRAREGLASANIQVTWAEDLVAALAREGYDHRFGARPLQRVIEQRIAVPLARWRVANPKVRNSTLHVGFDGQGSVTVRETATTR